jgi:hypothetical protein
VNHKMIWRWCQRGKKLITFFAVCTYNSHIASGNIERDNLYETHQKDQSDFDYASLYAANSKLIFRYLKPPN